MSELKNLPRPKAYSYIRMSTEGQLQGDSLRRQTDRSRLYALEHGLELDEATTFRLREHQEKTHQLFLNDGSEQSFVVRKLAEYETQIRQIESDLIKAQAAQAAS